MPQVVIMILKSFVAPLVVSFIKNLLFGNEANKSWRSSFFDKMREVIQDSETTIDDLTFLPILYQIEEATKKLDDKDFVMAFFTELTNEIVNREDPLVWMDTLFDFMETVIEDSETTFDDKLLLPMLIVARNQIKSKLHIQRA